MQCSEFREIACIFLDDELTIETNHDVILHVETCADCRRELAARHKLRLKLRAAITHAPEVQMSDEFIESLRAQLRARTWRGKLFGGFTRNRTYRIK